jgi:tRNA A37 threonylcarbamoyladenosine dehydratase
MAIHALMGTTGNVGSAAARALQRAGERIRAVACDNRELTCLRRQLCSRRRAAEIHTINSPRADPIAITHRLRINPASAWSFENAESEILCLQ